MERGQLKLTAQEVKDALRRRHPALPDPGYQGPGRWVTLEEWCGVDLIALDTWQEADVVGYEVKVSRGDMRSELLKPSKRAQGRSMCTRFYFAVPAGLLTPDELAYEEPEWEPEDFEVPRCTNTKCGAARVRRGWEKKMPKPRGPLLRGTESEGVSVHLGFGTDRGVSPHGGTYSHTYELKACCVVCRGYGRVWGAKSRAEREAPTLWVPRDVGLVAVGPRGCSVIRESPRHKITEPVIPWPFVGHRRLAATGLFSAARQDVDAATLSRLERQAIAQFARWMSFRPDPRHR